MTASAGVIYGPVTYPSNGHQYYLLSGNTRTNSEAEAVQMGSHLVAVSDAAENQWLISTFLNYGGVQSKLWIGFSDANFNLKRNT